MPYRPKFALKVALRAGYRCEICNKDVYSEFTHDNPKVPYHIHSATGLHLEPVNAEYCEAVSVPEGYKILDGRYVPMKALFALGERRFELGDAFCLCVDCHQNLHDVATVETKNRFPEFRGRYTPPALLEGITLFLFRRKKF
jgi:hypothetical protein